MYHPTCITLHAFQDISKLKNQKKIIADYAADLSGRWHSFFVNLDSWFFAWHSGPRHEAKKTTCNDCYKCSTKARRSFLLALAGASKLLATTPANKCTTYLTTSTPQDQCRGGSRKASCLLKDARKLAPLWDVTTNHLHIIVHSWQECLRIQTNRIYTKSYVFMVIWCKKSQPTKPDRWATVISCTYFHRACMSRSN